MKTCVWQIERQRQEEAERAGRALDEQEAALEAMKQAEKELKRLTSEQARKQAVLTEIGLRKAERLSCKTQLDLDIAEMLESKEAGAASVVRFLKHAEWHTQSHLSVRQRSSDGSQPRSFSWFK